MILRHIDILNYKNIAHAELDLAPGINCFIGNNGEGKTNLLDAVYFLSMCKSSTTSLDRNILRHGADFLMLQAQYEREDGSPETIHCGMKAGQKKTFRRGGKAYQRLTEHIGLVPLIVVSPDDQSLITGGSEERRRFMDIVISQCDPLYLEALMRYNKALQQRNALLKMEEEPDPELMLLWEESMAREGELIYQRRTAFVEGLIAPFQHYYNIIAREHEVVGLRYSSHCQRGPLLDVISRDRFKDRAVGYSLHGVHRDELEMTLDGYPMKTEGSQGQNKTFLIALKLAQFEILCHTASHTTPLLLLDDIFDKLDSTRVEQIVNIVSGQDFGQIFITDTNRDHLDQILSCVSGEHRIFHVNQGEIIPCDAASPL
ncbi:MAG: DNA replication/repair protein RecF [Bacteroidaceae bacterium]|nr:DNA replication/repair protein RecF [Bacteroidaceae bacterium]